MSQSIDATGTCRHCGWSDTVKAKNRNSAESELKARHLKESPYCKQLYPLLSPSKSNDGAIHSG